MDSENTLYLIETTTLFKIHEIKTHINLLICITQ